MIFYFPHPNITRECPLLLDILWSARIRALITSSVLGRTICSHWPIGESGWRLLQALRRTLLLRGSLWKFVLISGFLGVV